MGIGMNSNRFASPAPKNSNGANLDGSASFSNASYADWRTMDGRCESSSNMRLCPVAGLGHANGNDSRSSAAVLCANTINPSLFTKNIFSTQSEFWPQGGTLLGDEAGPVAGSSVRWGAFRSRRLPEVRHDIMGSPLRAVMLE